MMTNARAAYMDASIATASPARLLVMLYERLVLDVQRGLEAQQRQDYQETHRQLTHAQDIIMELHSGLKPELWSGGPALASLYLWLHGELIAANVAKDAARVAGARKLIEPLRDAWHEAARQLGTGQ